MESKKLIYLFMTIGGTVGGYVPALWGDSFFSMTSVLLGAIGSFIGIYIAFKLTH
jgi:hypothetical protein